MPIDKEKYILNTQVFEDVKLFDDSLDVCEELADQTIHKKITSKEDFAKILVSYRKKNGLNQQVIDSFYEIYKGFRSVKEKRARQYLENIIQNLYKPYFLATSSIPYWKPTVDHLQLIRNEDFQNVLEH
jgi:uncharacterized protein YfbU (UPF0304 family)